MSEEQEDLALKLWVVLSRSSRTVGDRIKQDIKSHGLNPTEFAVLELLFHKGDQPIQNIGKRILLSSGSITYVIDKLEERALLARKPCPDDRRVTYATITKKGKTLMETIFPEHQRAIQELFSELNDAEKQRLINLLKKLGIPLQEP